MTSQQAATQAKKRWGKKAYIRNSESMSSPEKRKASLDAVLAARAEIKRIDEEVARRLKELDWYQELQKQRRECREQISKTEGYAHYYRFSVGKNLEWATEIIGSGDTWEEAFAKADERNGKA